MDQKASFREAQNTEFQPRLTGKTILKPLFLRSFYPQNTFKIFSHNDKFDLLIFVQGKQLVGQIEALDCLCPTPAAAFYQQGNLCHPYAIHSENPDGCCASNFQVN